MIIIISVVRSWIPDESETRACLQSDEIVLRCIGIRLSMELSADNIGQDTILQQAFGAEVACSRHKSLDGISVCVDKYHEEFKGLFVCLAGQINAGFWVRE